MKISTVKEFRDKATQMLRGDEAVMITRRGKLAGFFIPTDEKNLPWDLKQQLQLLLAETVQKSLKAQDLTEEDILADFEASR